MRGVTLQPRARYVPIGIAGVWNCFTRLLEIGQVKNVGSSLKHEAFRASTNEERSVTIQRMAFSPSCWQKIAPFSTYEYQTLLGVLRFKFGLMGVRNSQSFLAYILMNTK